MKPIAAILILLFCLTMQSCDKCYQCTTVDKNGNNGPYDEICSHSHPSGDIKYIQGTDTFMVIPSECYAK